MWISGPITTVHDEHICHELAAMARVGLATKRWLSDKCRSGDVVLGNHPI
jgi:L-aminopeptidase/D-esterase-like protein